MRRVLVIFAAAHVAGAQAAETVRGHVMSAATAPIANAQVVVTKTVDGTAQTTATDSVGNYVVRWAAGTGSYLVQVSASGYQSFRQIVTRTGAAAADSTIVVDVTLQTGAPTQLATVFTKAARPTPDRQTTTDPGPGAVDATLNPMYASRRLSPDLAGDLTALAGMTPGVLQTASGFSVLGLGPTQNLVTLNGLAFPSGDIPRATPTLFHLTTSSYDPSIGWFSGARSNIDIAPSGPFTTRTTYWTADAPSLQFTDPIGARSGQRYGSVDASVGGGGLFAKDKLSYTYGAEAGRKTSSPATLLDARPDVLAHAGIAADTATRVLGALGQLGVPIGAPSLNATANKASFLGRIDYAPYDWNAMSAPRRTFDLVGYGKVVRQAGQALSPIATPGHSGSSSLDVGALQAEYSFYFSDGYLGELHSGVSVVRNTSAPTLDLPSGQALVASRLAPPPATIVPVQFGGNPSLGATSEAWTWESRGDVQFYPAGKALHRVKLSVDSRLDAGSGTPASNALGTFSYASLADLDANRPSAFTRTVGAPSINTGTWNGFASIGDLWRASQSLQVAYGVRLDADATMRGPAFDAAVDSVFGVRTDRGVSSWAVSPRLGFTYSTAAPHWLVPSAPLGVLRGGVGAFRDLADPNLLAAASAATGLADGVRQVACTGASVPAAAWQQFAADTSSIPRACAGDASGLGDVAPSVAVVDPRFRPSTSWRGNLGWSSSLGDNLYSVDATYALNLSQPGTTNLNFAGEQRFATADETRPVFVSPAEIVPASGAVSTIDARQSARFADVTSDVSDLRSTTEQLTVTARPYLGSWIKRYTGDIALAYTLSDVRAEQRGFDGTTFGDPAAKYWSRGNLDARHQLTMGMNVRPAAGLNFFLFGHAQSGLPYTPIIGSDVNGDGIANDRAFVFDPVRADSGLSSGMRGLLNAAPSGVKSCLGSQLGHAAAPMSCEGPWTATLNVAALLDPQIVHLPRTTVTFNFANVLGGLDLLLHGPSALRGWGAPAVPDPVLYRVSSFDPTRRQFEYQVNPRFGSTSSAATTLRNPFRITIDVSVDIAPPLVEQQLERWLAPGRGGRSGQRATSDQLAQRYARSVPNPFTGLLGESDSLLLTNDEIAALQHSDDEFRTHMDSVWRSLGRELAALPDDYSFDAASKRVDDVLGAAWEFTRDDVHRQLDAILTPVQRSMLTGWAKVFYAATTPLHYRLFISGG